jgi:hypothetical protein
MCNKKILLRPWPLDYEESIALAMCEECMIQTFSFTFVFVGYFPIQKIIFLKNIA